MIAKQHKTREEISLFSKTENESDSKNDLNLDQAKNKYIIKLQKKI